MSIRIDKRTLERIFCANFAWISLHLSCIYATKNTIFATETKRKEIIMLEYVIGATAGFIYAHYRHKRALKRRAEGKHSAWWHFWHDGNPFDSDTSYFY